MIDSKMRTAVADAIEWALLQELSFKVTQNQSIRHFASHRLQSIKDDLSI